MDVKVSPQRGRSQSRATREDRETSAASSPIEIPRKRTPIGLNASVISSSFSANEMIFDMSPVTSEFPCSHRPFVSLASKSTQNSHDFLYHFPTPSPIHQRSRTPSSPKILSEPSSPLSSTGTSSSQSNIVGHAMVKGPVSRRGHSLLDEYDLLLKEPPTPDGTTKSIVRGRGSASHRYGRGPPPLERLSPGPRKASTWTSPWILPGKEDAKESTSPAFSEMPDAPVSEFQHQLFRRIDKYTRSRITPYSSYM